MQLYNYIIHICNLGTSQNYACIWNNNCIYTCKYLLIYLQSFTNLATKYWLYCVVVHTQQYSIGYYNNHTKYDQLVAHKCSTIDGRIFVPCPFGQRNDLFHAFNLKLIILIRYCRAIFNGLICYTQAFDGSNHRSNQNKLREGMDGLIIVVILTKVE